VILINLLPHREAARKQRREVFYVSLGAAALAGGLISGVIFLAFQSAILIQQSKNVLLKNEITRLEGQIKDIANLQTEIAALRARQQAVEDLQADRNLPVNLLNELAKQLPDGVYITSMRQDNQSVAVTGVAQSNERVSELLRNLANNSEWLARPELIEIVAATLNVGNTKETRRVSNFNMRVQLKRAADPQKAGGAAAKPAVAASSAVAAVPAASPAAAPASATAAGQSPARLPAPPAAVPAAVSATPVAPNGALPPPPPPAPVRAPGRPGAPS
jgi:type IV pilus assembly protein PilN